MCAYPGPAPLDAIEDVYVAGLVALMPGVLNVKGTLISDMLPAPLDPRTRPTGRQKRQSRARV